MGNKNLIIVIAVIAIAIAGIGAALLLFNGEPEVKDTPPTSTDLLIYGNANGDGTIDSNDVRIVENVLNAKENYTLASYPLADANHNGRIDSGDVEIVKKLAERKETEVYVIAQMDEDDDPSYSVVKVQYPLKHVVTVNAEVTGVCVQLGVSDKVAGYLSSNYSEFELYSLNKAGSVNIDPTQNRTVKEAGYKKIIELDTKYRQNGGNGIDAIFIYNTNAIKTYKADFETAGIPVIHTKCTNPRDSIVGFRTFGFLFGTEGEKQGNNIAEYTVKVLDHVSDTLKKNNISGDKMTDVLVLFSKTSIAEANSQYTYATQEAGGNVINQQSGASAKLSNEESILTFKNPVPEVIVSFTTMGFKKVTDEYLTGTVWDIEKLSYLNKSPAYKDLVYVNASLPVSARIATVAEVLYPDLFKDYGATTWQTYADNFMPFLDECADDKDYNVKTDCTNTITYSDYKRAGGKN